MRAQPVAASQNRRIVASLPFVEALARRMAASMPNSIDVGDLVQDGVLGLIDAAHRFDVLRRIRGQRQQQPQSTCLLALGLFHGEHSVEDYDRPFPAAVEDATHETDAIVLEIGSRTLGSVGYYSDIDMVAPAGGKPAPYTHRDGTPYDGIRRRGPENS